MTLTVLLLFAGIASAEGEWTTNSEGNIYNTNPGSSVGVGTTSPSGKLHVRESDTTGSIRIGGGNYAGNHRVYINSDPTNSYIDSFGNSQYKLLKIESYPLLLNSISGGNVGIGTPAPAAKLDVMGGNIKIESSDPYTRLQLWNTGGGRHYQLLSGANGLFGIYDMTSTDWRLSVNSIGNVGIGTTSPVKPLHVVTSTTDSGAKIESTNAGTHGASLVLYQNSSSPAPDDVAGRLQFNGKRDDGNEYWMAYIDGLWTNPAAGSGKSRMAFHTRSGETDNVVMTLDHDGKVGIGTTNPKQKFHIHGDGSKLRLGADTSGTDFDNEIEFAEQTDANGVMTAGFRIFNHAASNEYLGIHAITTTDLGGIDIHRDTGNVGIGITNPLSTLHVVTSGSPFNPDTASDDLIVGSSAATGISIQSGSNDSGRIVFAIDGQIERGGIVYDHANNRMRFDTNNKADQMVIDEDGNVGIGTINPQSKLAVKGIITAEEIKVESGWSDFVFNEDYDLASLDEVESFIRENKHLPDIPSAIEVEQKGLAVSEILAKQMQKIEEMTLYLIELRKGNEALKAKNAELERRLSKLEKELQN